MRAVFGADCSPEEGVADAAGIHAINLDYAETKIPRRKCQQNQAKGAGQKCRKWALRTKKDRITVQSCPARKVVLPSLRG
jgi:hypothetical protein